MQTIESVLETKGSKVTTIDRNASVGKAADLMSAQKIGALVVTEGDKVVGIFTERDILTRVVARRRPSDETKVADAMTAPMTCCRRDTRVSECEAVMAEKGIRHIPVVENGKLYGLISSRDLIATEVAAKQETIKQLEHTIDSLNEYLYTKT